MHPKMSPKIQENNIDSLYPSIESNKIRMRMMILLYVSLINENNFTNWCILQNNHPYLYLIYWSNHLLSFYEVLILKLWHIVDHDLYVYVCIWFMNQLETPSTGSIRQASTFHILFAIPLQPTNPHICNFSNLWPNSSLLS